MTRATPLPDRASPTPVGERPHRAGAVLYTISALLLLVGLCMTSGIVVALIHGERPAVVGFAIASGVALVCALSGFLNFRRYRDATLLPRDGFLVVVLSWLVVSAFSALPYVITGSIPRYTDAFFETMSGFTTTGATLLTDIESLPRSVLFWRSLTQWLGGMGIVVLTVAILPRLGIMLAGVVRRHPGHQDVYAATARHLADVGHDVVRAADLGLSRATDEELLDVARERGRLFVTRDRDFGRIVFLNRLPAPVLYLRMIMMPDTQDAVHRELAGPCYGRTVEP